MRLYFSVRFPPAVQSKSPRIWVKSITGLSYRCDQRSVFFSRMTPGLLRHTPEGLRKELSPWDYTRLIGLTITLSGHHANHTAPRFRFRCHSSDTYGCHAGNQHN